MLQPQYRLRNSADLERTRQEGRVWRNPLAILLVKANDQDTSRFAFTASKRVGKAVSRNRARRLLREAVRRHLAEIKPGWDLLFIAREKTVAASFSAVEAAVLWLLASSELLADISERDVSDPGSRL